MNRRKHRPAAMADQLLEIDVILFRPSSSAASLGFSLIGVDDKYPPAVCNIVDDSPAAKCKKIEVGDVIIEINHEDVQACTIKEVLKCLELAQNPITLKLIRDPVLKNKVHDQLEHNFSQESFHNVDPPSLQHHPTPIEMVAETNSNKIKIPKCESYIKTGDRVFKLSLNAEFTILPQENKKAHDLEKNDSFNKFQKANSYSASSSSSVENERSNIAKHNSGNASPISLPSKVSKHQHRPHSQNPVQYNSQHLMSSSISNYTQHEDITSSYNTETITNIKPLENEDKKTYNADHIPNEIPYFLNCPPKVKMTTSIPLPLKTSSDQRQLTKEPHCNKNNPTCSYSNTSCSEVQNTINADLLTNSSDSKEAHPSDSGLTILAKKSKNQNNNTKIPCSYDTHMENQTMKQVESPDKRKLVRSVKNKNYFIDKKNVNHDNYHTLNFDLGKNALHSSRYFSKAIDIPSAGRLAKHLFYLEGFKNSDVSYYLSKNDEFSKAVAEKYFTYFEFKGLSLDMALRYFLDKCALTEYTEEKDKLLACLSKRYLDCNPRRFFSADAVHTLICTILELNFHLHDPTIVCKVTRKEFIKSLTGLNGHENFPRHILKSLYKAIKRNPLKMASDYDLNENRLRNVVDNQSIDYFEKKIRSQIMKNESLYENVTFQSMEYKIGRLTRKCCERFGKKTLKGKRGWKSYYCKLQNLCLYLYKNEFEFHKSKTINTYYKVISLHHSFATRATDYTKKEHVFRLITADRSEYLFETDNSKELTSWINSINFVCARLSASRLSCVVENRRKFQLPLLPSSPMKLNLRVKIQEHEETFNKLMDELINHLRQPLKRGIIFSQFNEEKKSYLYGELNRYALYILVLKAKMNQLPRYDSSSILGEVDDE